MIHAYLLSVFPASPLCYGYLHSEAQVNAGLPSANHHHLFSVDKQKDRFIERFKTNLNDKTNIYHHEAPWLGMEMEKDFSFLVLLLTPRFCSKYFLLNTLTKIWDYSILVHQLNLTRIIYKTP